MRQAKPAVPLSKAEPREVDASLQELREQLERKTLILDAVAHELAGPLTVIWGMASTLCGPHASNVPAEERDLWLSRIATNAQRMATLLANLQDLDRESRGELAVRRRRFDVVALVRRVVAGLDADDHPIVMPTGKVVVTIDPFLVERIVANLLTNAVRHTPAGTAIRLGVTASGSTLELAIDDDGPGIAADLRDRVFERFTSDESTNPGVGLGLSLVKRLAVLHGGDVWLADRPDGASFRVLLSTDGRSRAGRPPNR